MRTPAGRLAERIDWRNVSLLGIDVGFSEKAKSTGVAIYYKGRLAKFTCVGSSPQQRSDVIPSDVSFDAIAIDGPIVADSDPPLVRACERFLSSGKFNRRCKPGFSHFGTGLAFRKAATAMADEMRPRTSAGATAEAFPNAFLGVLLDDGDYQSLGPIKRGNKSDAYYMQVAATGRFEAMFDRLRWRDGTLLATLHDNAGDATRAAHDKRAALICLLTAACVLAQDCVMIGDREGGFIHLPPLDLWADWAREQVRGSEWFASIPPIASA